MSDTPMTDAKWAKISVDLPFALASKSPVKSLGEIVPANFARDLERALNECVEALKNTDTLLGRGHERDAALAHVAKLREKYRV